jgi:SAM-dependent methyltransferase
MTARVGMPTLLGSNARMAHVEQMAFFQSLKQHLPQHFKDVRTLEVGALDINGSIRGLFEGGQYTGVDIAEGPGIDLACPGQLLEFATGSFDTVVSAECFEHNPYWRETFANMLRMARPGGLVIMTCATQGRKEHGTTRTKPQASPLTVAQRWDYYRNLSAKDIESAVHLPGWLSSWRFWTNRESYDLYFLGFRQGGSQSLSPTMVDEFDARYSFTASAKAIRRGIKAQFRR